MEGVHVMDIYLYMSLFLMFMQQSKFLHIIPTNKAHFLILNGITGISKPSR